MKIPETKESAADACLPEIVDFNVHSLFAGLAFALKPELDLRQVELRFDCESGFDSDLRGNCQRLGETLANLVKGTFHFKEYGNILFSMRSETLSRDQVLLQFEISPETGVGPRFRFYAGLPKKCA